MGQRGDQGRALGGRMEQGHKNVAEEEKVEIRIIKIHRDAKRQGSGVRESAFVPSRDDRRCTILHANRGEARGWVGMGTELYMLGWVWIGSELDWVGVSGDLTHGKASLTRASW